MANLSDAYGTITISIVTGEVATFVKAWNLLSKSMSNGEYATYFDEITGDESRIRRNDTEDGKVELSMCSSFSGFGRWAYECNIHYFGSWLWHNTDEEERDFLERLAFSIEYDFSDYEPGCEVFYEMVASNIHASGMSLREIRYTEESSNDLEISATELINHEILDEGSIADIGVARPELKEWFIANERNEHTRELIKEVFDNDDGYKKFCREHDNEIFYSCHEYDIDWLDYLF